MKCCIWQSLHCLIRYTKSSGTEIYYNLEFLTCDPLKYNMDKVMLIVSICMEKSKRMKRVKEKKSLIETFSVNITKMFSWRKKGKISV